MVSIPNLGDLLDKHPAFALLSVASVCVASTVGVVQFLNARHLSALEERHKAELISSVNDLEREIADLGSELSSIRRGISVEYPSLFDVRNLMVSEDSAFKLPDEYQRFEDGVFLVKVSADSNWIYDSTSESDNLLSNIDDDCSSDVLDVIRDRTFQRLGDSKNSTVHVWHSKTKILERPKISDNFNDLKEVIECSSENYFTPSIEVRVIDEKWLRDTTQFIVFKRNLEKKRAEDTVEETITSAIHKQETVNEADLESEQKSYFDLDVDRAFSGEVASGLLTSILFLEQAQTAIFQSSRHKIVSAQKTRNALYLHTRSYFQIIKEEDAKELVFDREHFVIGNGNTSLYVKISLPTVEKYYESYLWTQSWLSGLRVRLEI